MLFYILLIFSFLIGGEVSGVELDEHKNLSKAFTKKVIIYTKQKNFDYIAYGNSTYGYYYVKKFHRKKGRIYFKIVPPGYRKTVDFYLVSKRSDRDFAFKKVKSVKFTTPVPSLYRSLLEVKSQGTFTNNYFVITGALPRKILYDPNAKLNDPNQFKKRSFRYSFVMILNKIGEPVWVHVPYHDETFFQTYTVVKPIKKGVFGIMFGKKDGFFEIVKYNGNILHKFSPKELDTPFTMHHDFLFKRKNELYTLSTARDILKSKNKSYLYDTLIKVDLKKQSYETVIDFSEIFHPLKDSYYTGNPPDDKKFVLWGEPKADFDFLHINSIDEFKKNHFILSIRNLSKIICIDRKKRKVVWSIGSDKKDTIRIDKKESSFMHQHTPQFIGDNYIILFDNGRKRKKSRIIMYKLDFDRGKATVHWVYEPNPSFYSKNRSSVAVINKKRFLAYFVSPIIGGKKRPTGPSYDYFMEVDYSKKDVVGKMRVKFNTLSPGYRVLPLDTIGEELVFPHNPEK